MIDDPWNDPELPLSAARQLDEVCCRFEADLQAGKVPRIEAFLDGAAGVKRRALLRELLAMEVHYRRQQHEPVARAPYLARFPDERDLVEFVFREADSAAAGSAGAAFRRQATLAELPSSFLMNSSRVVEPTLGSEGPHPAPQLAGRPLDLPSAERRYTMRELLARGGMGEVFLADDERIGRRVALKRLRPGSDELRERFLAEAQITGQLEHPGIVPLYDVGQDGEGDPFYIMKLVEGSTLRQAIKDHHQGASPAGAQRSQPRRPGGTDGRSRPSNASSATRWQRPAATSSPRRWGCSSTGSSPVSRRSTRWRRTWSDRTCESRRSTCSAIPRTGMRPS